MTASPTDLSALLGSRICHDLISPLGAISNGVELLQLAGAEGPEITLIREAVENANQRIRFFRTAFGSAADGQMTRESEIRSVLGADNGTRKVAVDWQPRGDVPRREVKLAFLALLCLESALPWGGRISVARTGQSWRLSGSAERLKVEAELWEMLAGTRTAALPATLPSAAQLQFALIGPELALQGREAVVETGESTIALAF